jgi:hypothetical protein
MCADSAMQSHALPLRVLSASEPAILHPPHSTAAHAFPASPPHGPPAGANSQPGEQTEAAGGDYP